MPYTRRPFQPETPYANQVSIELNKANDNFDILAQAFVSDNPETFKVKNASYSDNSNYSNNSDKLDGYDASLTPAPNVIPVTLNNTKLHPSFLDFDFNNYLSIPYAKLYISYTNPTSPEQFANWYDLNTDKLYIWNGSEWIEINWQDRVKADVWYQMGKLRINSNRLEISNDGSNWYQVFPCVGQVIEVVAGDVDSFKIAYLSVGQTLLVRNKSKVRAAAVDPSLWQGCYYHTYSGLAWFGLFPSGITISDGYGAYVAGASSSTYGDATFSRNFVPITEQAGEAHNWADFSIQIVNNYMTTTSVGHGSSGAIVHAHIGSGSFPSNGYFLGITSYEGTVVNVDYFAVRRLA